MPMADADPHRAVELPHSAFLSCVSKCLLRPMLHIAALGSGALGR
jgi:hypothetical protein